MRGEQGGLPTGCDQHVVACGRHTCARSDPRGNGITQGGDAGDRGIAGMPAHRRAVHVLQNGRCGADVMLANGQFGHLCALGNHLARTVEDLPAVRSAAQNRVDTL